MKVQKHVHTCMFLQREYAHMCIELKIAEKMDFEVVKIHIEGKERECMDILYVTNIS